MSSSGKVRARRTKVQKVFVGALKTKRYQKEQSNQEEHFNKWLPNRSFDLHIISQKQIIACHWKAGRPPNHSANCSPNGSLKPFVVSTMIWSARTMLLPTKSIFLPAQTISLSAQKVFLRARTIFLPAKTILLSARTMFFPSAKTIFLSAKAIFLSAKTILLSARTLFFPSAKTIFLSAKTIFLSAKTIPVREDYVVAREIYIPTREDYILVHEHCIPARGSTSTAIL